jgi:hypothetical protein
MPQSHLYFFILLLIIAAIIGIGTAFVGFLGMQKRRPYFITQRIWFWGYYLLFFIFWTLFLASFVVRVLENHNVVFSFGSVLIVVLFSALPAFLLGVLPRLSRAKSTSRILILGINKKVKEIFRQSLEQGGINYREMHEDFEISDLNTKVEILLWSTVGYAELRFDPRKAKPVMEKIIQTMKAYNQDHSDHFSLRFMTLLVFFGLLMAGIGIFLAYSFLEIVMV